MASLLDVSAVSKRFANGVHALGPIDFLVDHELTNVVPIFNCNRYGQSDVVSPEQSAETLTKKLVLPDIEPEDLSLPRSQGRPRKPIRRHEIKEESVEVDV
jgi:hypothetical protein